MPQIITDEGRTAPLGSRQVYISSFSGIPNVFALFMLCLCHASCACLLIVFYVRVGYPAFGNIRDIYVYGGTPFIRTHISDPQISLACLMCNDMSAIGSGFNLLGPFAISVFHNRCGGFSVKIFV